MLTLVVLLLLTAGIRLTSIQAKNICVASYGSTHMNVYQPIIKELINRKHNLTIFLPSGTLESTIKSVAIPPSPELHYIPFKSDRMSFSKDALALVWKNSRFVDTLFESFGLLILASQTSVHRSSSSNNIEFIEKVKDSLCDVLLSDVMQLQMIDLATKLDIPVISILNFVHMGIPFSNFIGKSARRSLADMIVTVTMPYVGQIVMNIAGTMYYGYPRHFFSSIYARPYMTPTFADFSTSHLSKNMFILGPSNVKIALSTDECWNCDENRSNNHSIVIDVSSTTVHCSQNRPLIVGKKRLLLAAFGTHFEVPKHAIQRLCEAFRMVLNSGSIDKVIFSRRPLDYDESDGDIKQCKTAVVDDLSSCNDDRIWSTTWINQKELLDSGAVGLFLTHGGYSSILEATEARVPFVVLPVAFDQSFNALVVADAGMAETVHKTDSPTVIASALMKVLQNPTRYVDNAKSSITSTGISAGLLSYDNNGKLVQINSMQAKGADFVEKIATEGVNNSLQRLVPYVWSHYANKDGPSFLSFTFFMSTLQILLGLFIFLSPLIFSLIALKFLTKGIWFLK
jgi:hypothetical protein